jgi:hypothetical protein
VRLPRRGHRAGKVAVAIRPDAIALHAAGGVFDAGQPVRLTLGPRGVALVE